MPEYVNCNLCGKDDTTQLYQMEKVGVVQCNHCGLVYTNPCLTEEERTKLYDMEYFSGGSDLTCRFNYLDNMAISRVDARTKLKELLMYKKEPGNILEIGCGTGTFLEIARHRGWRSRGLEISEFAGHYAREELGLEVFVGRLEDTNFPAASFDVICMYHVLEHIPFPKEYCQKLYHLLKPDGLLVIALPDISSPRARCLKEKWESLQPYVHLFHFSRESLTELLSQTGYKIIGTSCQSATGLMTKSVTSSGIIKGLRNFIVKYFRYLNWLRILINLIKVKLFKDYSSITVYVRKT